MVNLVQEHSPAKGHLKLKLKTVIKPSLILLKGLKIQCNITQEINVSLAKDIPNALSGSFGHGITEDLPETSNYEIFVLRNR